MIKWLLFKKRLIKNPWSLDPYRKVSEKEAARLIKARGGYPSATHIMELARIKFGKTPEEWFSMTGFRAASDVREQKMRRLLPYKRIAVAAICIILLTAYLGFTPSGRALAETIYTTITEFFEGMIYIHPKGTNYGDTEELAVEDASADYESQTAFSSLDELSKEFEKGFFYFDDKQFIQKQFYFTEYSWKTPSITLGYMYRGADIILFEEYPTTYDINLAISGKYISYQLPTGSILEGSYDKESRSFSAATAYDGLVLSIYIDNVESEYMVSEILASLSWKN